MRVGWEGAQGSTMRLISTGHHVPWRRWILRAHCTGQGIEAQRGESALLRSVAELRLSPGLGGSKAHALPATPCCIPMSPKAGRPSSVLALPHELSTCLSGTCHAHHSKGPRQDSDTFPVPVARRPSYEMPNEQAAPRTELRVAREKAGQLERRREGVTEGAALCSASGSVGQALRWKTSSPGIS